MANESRSQLQRQIDQLSLAQDRDDFSGAVTLRNIADNMGRVAKLVEAATEAVKDLPEPAQVAMEASVTGIADENSDRAYSDNDYVTRGMSSAVEVASNARALSLSLRPTGAPLAPRKKFTDGPAWAAFGCHAGGSQVHPRRLQASLPRMPKLRSGAPRIPRWARERSR